MIRKESKIDEDKRGTYAMFILRTFAEELDWAVRHNDVDVDMFEMDMHSADDLIIDDIVDQVKEALFTDDDVDVDEYEPEYVECDDYADCGCYE